MREVYHFWFMPLQWPDIWLLIDLSDMSVWFWIMYVLCNALYVYVACSGTKQCNGQYAIMLIIYCII